MGEIRYRKEYRSNRLSTSYRHSSTGDNDPPIISEDGFGDQIERNTTGKLINNSNV